MVALDASSPSSLSSRKMETSSGAPSLGGVLNLDWEARRLLLPAGLRQVQKYIKMLAFVSIFAYSWTYLRYRWRHGC